MYNLKLNNYHLNPKNSNIYTPPEVSEFLFNLLQDKVKASVVLDPCSGQGSLLAPWKNPVIEPEELTLTPRISSSSRTTS